MQLIVSISQIEIIVERELHEGEKRELADTIKANVEAITKRKCVVD